MTYILKGRLKGAVEEADKEKALKEVFESTFQEQIAELVTAKQRSVEVERACVATKKRVADLESKLGEVEVKLP